MHVEPVAYDPAVPAAEGFYALGGDPHHPGARRPAVVMIHDVFGMTDYLRGQARTLAEAGYAVLAVDLYAGERPADVDAAMALMKAVDREAAVADMRAAVAWLRARPEVAGDRIASLGWCFGGAMSLRLALAQKDLAGCVIYYGVQLETDVAKLAGMPPVLGIFGAEDQNPTPETVRAFEAALGEAEVPAKVVLFEGAGHAFASANRPDRYRPTQAQAAWRETLEFLAEMGNARR
jgi:carboxymethylenebutenolidase